MINMSGTGGAFVVPALRLGHPDGGEELCSVIVEDVLTVLVDGIGSFTLMWTPTQGAGEPTAYTTDDGALGEGGLSEPLILAAGFLFSEGVIAGLADIRAIAFCPDNPKVVDVHLFNPPALTVRRANVIVNSSCGVCGEGNRIEELCDSLPEPTAGSLTVTTEVLHGLMREMRSHQTVFEATGGAHAAAVFTADGRIVATAEDLGRHNALDKVIGRCLFDGIDMAMCGVLLSSRLSLEMVAKAVRARFQVVAAVSGPTSLAVELATRKGVTLCGFVREGRCTVYSHRSRIGGYGLPPALTN